jgi:hypothetical protein
MRCSEVGGKEVVIGTEGHGGGDDLDHDGAKVEYLPEDPRFLGIVE